MKKDTIKCFVGLLILLFLIEFSRAQSPSSQWKHTLAFPYEEGKDSVMVQTGYVKDGSIQLIYELPVAKTKKLDKKLGNNNMSQVILGSAPATANEGEPVLPVIPVKVIIPKGYSIEKNKIKVSRGGKTQVPGIHCVTYGEATFPLILGAKPRKAEPKQHIYNSDNAFPGKSFNLVTVQRKHGVTVAYINLHPVTYLPKSSKLICYTNISLKIPIKRVNTGIDPKVQGHVERFNFKQIGVDNPEDLKSYQTRSLASLAPIGICNPLENYQYVIVTNQAVRDATTDVTVMDLIAHKQARGLTATIVTIEDIYANYSGVDNAEKLRNFIIDAYNNWGTEYVLLGGDTNILPFRYLNANGTSIPSDLYFQCLDGTFDFDGDGVWGEPTDGPEGGEVDLTAEVYIGRASAENADEMSNFVYKTLAYENEVESAPYLRNALIAGEYLGSQFGPGEFAYAMPYMDEIHFGSNASGYTTVGFSSCASFTVNTLYDYNGTWPSSEIIDQINSGTYSIINHLGHANTDYVFKFYNSSADGLTNNNFIFAYSQGCIPGDYTADCIGEHLTTSHRHGMYAVVFNSRYGWGAYNDSRETMDGPSQRFDRQFWDAYFGEYIFNLGAINADSHEDNIWDINGNYIRWCFYESNLLGDPHTPLRGQIIGPSVAYSSHVTSDATGGNGDGVVNPGEQIDITATLVNVGSGDATDVNAEISTSDSYISILDNTASFGDILCCGAAKQALDDVGISISSGCPTPHTATLDLTITDDQTNSWTSSFTISVYTSSQISGYVTTLTGGNPVEGATVEYSGPLSGSVQTNASGYYMFGGIDGTYEITVLSDDYLPSTPQSITIPPNATNVNFLLSRPEIAVTPQSINETILVGESIDVNATIFNNGDAPLEFTITSVDNTFSLPAQTKQVYADSHFVDIPKDQKDTRIGLSVKLGKGGPDNFGYSWKDSDEPNGPQFVWNDISGTGTLLTTASSCDDCYQQQAIPFSFPFYDNEFTSIFVSSNGYITFGSGSSQYGNYPLPSTSMPPNLIAGFFDDLTTSGAGDIYYQDFGNKVIIQFNNVPRLAGDATLTYQIVLEESGAIYLYFENVSGNLTNATTGIQNGTRDDGLTVVYNATYLKNDLAVQIKFTPDWLRTTPVSGTVNPGNFLPISVTLDATELFGGVYSGALEFTHNDPVSDNPFSLPCILTVDGIKRIAVTPEDYDFGNVWYGVQGTTTLSLTNAGDEATTVNSITSDNEEFTHNAVLPLTVPPFESVTFEAIFAPVDVGSESGVFTIISDAEDNPVLTVNFSGTGTAPPEIAISPSSFSEELDAGSSLTRILTITNNGGANLNYSITSTGSGMPTDLLVSYWSFSEGAGDVLNDEIGNNNGVIKGAIWVYDEGRSALSFNGIDDTVLVPHPVDGSMDFGTGDFSVGAWINTTANTGTSGDRDEILSKGDASINGFALSARNNNACFWVGASGDFSGTSEINDGEWHLIVGVREAGTVRLYVDATLETSGSNSQTVNTATDFFLGMHGTKDLCYFEGLISSTFLYEKALTIEEIEDIINGYSSWLAIPDPSGTVQSGSSADVNIVFQATGLFGGDYFGQLNVTHNDPGDPVPLVVPCALTVNGFRGLIASPENYDFGNLWAGLQSSGTITLSNAGSEVTTVNSITSDNGEFTHNAVLPITVPPFESVTFEAIFAPVDAGAESGVLTINSDAEDNPVLTVSLTGTGIQPPGISVVPDNFHEELDYGGTVTRVLTIENPGGDILDFDISLEPSSLHDNFMHRVQKPYHFNGNNFHTISSVDDTLNGLEIDEITIKPLSMLALDLTGIRIAYDCAHGERSSSTLITLFNDLIARGAVIYENFNSLSIQLLDTIDILWIDDNASIPFSASEVSELDEWLHSGGAILMHSDQPGPLSTIFEPHGITFKQKETSEITTNIISHTVTQKVKSVYIPNAVSALGVENNAVPIILDKGGVPYVCISEVGKGKIVAICDELLADYYIGKCDNRILGNRAVDWLVSEEYVDYWLSVNPISGSVNPDGSMDLNVEFNSEGLIAGDYACNILVVHNAPAEPSPVSIPATLTVNSLRDLSVDPQQFTFSDIWIGNREVTIFTLSNPGNAATTVNSIISDNPVFTHNAVLPFSVPPFESVAFEVEFAPVELGMESGVLTINSDAENNPITVSLSGAGVAPPEITVSPSSFNEVLYMGHSLTRILTITNNGGDVLNYSIISTGSNTPTDLLVSYWPFSEGAGDILNDEIGNNNGDINGAVWVYEKGRSALLFDGIDDTVLVPHPVDGSMDFGTGDFSVAVWINTITNTGTGVSRDEIVSKGDASINGFALSALNNKACFWVGASGQFFGTSNINDGEWHLVVGVREAGTVRLYVDANLETSGSNSNNVNTSTDFFIGMHGTKALCYFDGLISSTYLYARALTVDEIEDIYGVPSWLTITDPSGAVQSGSFADINIVFESAGLAEGIYSGRLDILHNAPGTPVPLVVPCALTVIDQIPSTSRILFIGQSASTAAYGNNYIMEEIIIGSPTSGTAKGSKYQIELK